MGDYEETADDLKIEIDALLAENNPQNSGMIIYKVGRMMQALYAASGEYSEVPDAEYREYEREVKAKIDAATTEYARFIFN